MKNFENANLQQTQAAFTVCEIVLIYIYSEMFDTDMVCCCSPLCANNWFHVRCVNLQQLPDGDWYCSNECRDSTDYIYCWCQSKKGREDRQMFECERGSDCLNHQYYHPSCVGMDKLPGIHYMQSNTIVNN